MRFFFSSISAALILLMIAAPALGQGQDQNTVKASSFRVRLDSPFSWTLWDDSRNELTLTGHLSGKATEWV